VRDLFREGLKLGESLARLPWEAARRMTGDKSETLTKAADLGERLGTLPFRAAQTVLGPAAGGETPPPAAAGGSRGAATQRQHKGRVVVLGAGYAGLPAYLELQDHISRDWDLVLVNGDRYHWFVTELHTLVAGEPEDAVRVPLSRIVNRPGRLIVDRVTGVDLANRQVNLAGQEPLRYDYLVFGLGSEPEYFGLPGVAEHSLIVGNWQSATRLREQIREAVNAGGDGRLPHIVVAGGGLTGVEVAGELADEYGTRLRLSIVEAGPDIMAGFAPDLVRAAREVLTAKNIEIRAGNPIARVEPNLIHFKDGSTLEFDLLVWSGGVRGNSLLKRAGFEVTPRGRAKVDPYLRATGHADVYVVGDSASFTDPGTGRELAPTGQAAVQMGHAAGSNILRRIKGQAEQPFVPRIKGSFASLGRQQGVGQMGEEQFVGLPALAIKHMIEAHHAWETGGGAVPLIRRLLAAPQRFMKGRPVGRVSSAGGRVAAPAARPEARPEGTHHA
jgi:NADH:ubiquinone reductase (H+-translocating)